MSGKNEPLFDEARLGAIDDMAGVGAAVHSPAAATTLGTGGARTREPAESPEPSWFAGATHSSRAAAPGSDADARAHGARRRRHCRRRTLLPRHPRGGGGGR